MAGVREEKKLFVGGLPQTVDSAKLRSYFQQFGPLAAAEVVMDNVTGKSKGYGFIQFLTIDGVAKCLAHYFDHTFDGKWVEVRQFGDKTALDRSKGGGKGGVGSVNTAAAATANALAALGCSVPGQREGEDDILRRPPPDRGRRAAEGALPAVRDRPAHGREGGQGDGAAAGLRLRGVQLGGRGRGRDAAA
eukprot:CAMPEP_0179296336 /NCGR_PEP_ID=MMETSP0797-20121207/44886_1 /TAXON_ID=47934 /ORGANISM="Dinophysis acuminata, Strain DAEP01" /LENGTH=190 /DNA_ID=CAMNT_0021005611 /DNA_START=8 /DNA_END=577 /DNA_ORIENTATION=-